MLEIIATQSGNGHEQRLPLTPGSECTIGQSADTDLCVDWDPLISRRHVGVIVKDDSVHVRRLESGRNPLIHNGESVDEFELAESETFVIGSTIFRLSRSGQDRSPQPIHVLEEIRFDAGQLRNVAFSDAEKRLEVLTHLPKVIQRTSTDDDFFLAVAQLLLSGIPRAEAVAIVEPTDDGVHVLHQDRRTETRGAIRPSTRLVRDAIVTSGRSVLHAWEPDRNTDPQYTATAGFNWAFCTPVSVFGEAKRGLYVAGSHEPSSAGEAAAGRRNLLQADVRFTELVAEVVSSLRRLSSLERHQAGLRQFFAPPILAALGDNLDTDILEPRECEVTILFCDLRGFSKQAESEEDDLTGLLSRVSQALGVMTEQILRFGGVTGDFQGDAALGFWGWPFPSESAPLNACRAALGIRASFEKASGIKDHPLADFAMGIGIAHGRAVAGKIGTAEQVKVTVFGPVVNLASRLESMTTQLHAPILLDESIASLVREKLDASEGRTRKLARILPVGMERPVLVSELLPPEDQFPLLSDEQIARYEDGVDSFIAGNWEVAWQCLHDMPAGDRAQDFLSIPIVQSNRRAPEDWDGVIRLTRK